MFIALAVFAGVVGLGVSAAAVFAAISIYKQIKASDSTSPKDKGERTVATAFPWAGMLRWTILDYGLLLLFAFAALFLLVDLIAVLRDPRPYPDFHIGYLLCGFAFVLLHSGFLYLRLLFLMRASRLPGAPIMEKNGEPQKADGAE